MAKETGEAAIRRAIVEVYGELARRQLIEGSAGNVSVRSGNGMLITPTGCDAQSLRAAHVVETSLEGESTGKLRPSSEWAMHAEVYRRVPGAHAVVHTHADHSTALACLRRPIPAFHYMVYGFGGNDVPLVDYLPFGSRELGAAAGAALESRSACLLANHGTLSRGATLKSALDATLRLETLARQYLLALSAGEPVLLGKPEMAEVARRYADYGRQPRAKVKARWMVP